MADPADEPDAYVGNLCQLQEHSVTAVIIYANLPNIPLDGTGAAFGGQLTSTFLTNADQPRSSSFSDICLVCSTPFL